MLMNDGKVQTDWDRFPFTLKIVVVLGLPFQQTNDDYGDDDDDDDTGKTTEKRKDGNTNFNQFVHQVWGLYCDHILWEKKGHSFHKSIKFVIPIFYIYICIKLHKLCITQKNTMLQNNELWQ